MNAKILKVIEPMFSLLPGDILELTDDGTSYIAEISDSDFNELEVVSATLKISANYAQELVKAGYLQVPAYENKGFINVFDEIDSLLAKYNEDLSNVGSEDMPECMRVEKATVLKNMIKLLEHLKSVKK